MSYLALAKQAHALIRAEARGLGTTLDASTPGAAALLANLLPMPLSEFARRGSAIAVRVPWYGELLWFVPAEAEAIVLEREGIHRGRIWTAEELLGLLSIPGLEHGRVLTVARAKLEFTGEVVMVSTSPCEMLPSDSPHPPTPMNHKRRG